MTMLRRIVFVLWLFVHGYQPNGCKTRHSGPWARRPFGPVDLSEQGLAKELKRQREYDAEVAAWREKRATEL